MRLLITGGSGKLGYEISKLYKDVSTPKRSEMDITNFKQVLKTIRSANPSIVIHTAALTDVRKCESDRVLAWTINVEGTQNIVEAVKKVNSKIYLIYISTACVFDGLHAPFYEKDIPYPKNFYGLTKLGGEMIVQESGLKNKLIVRTNFVKRESWPYPNAFTDRYGNYLFGDTLAVEIKKAVSKKRKGVIHITGTKKMSMYELAKTVSPKVGKITLKNYKGPPLTKDMTLGSKKWKSATFK